MQVAIVGAGAMGSFFGGRLAAAGHQVCLVDVNRAHIDAINRDGLRVASESGETIARLRAGAAEEFAGACDFLILFTKTVHSRVALRSTVHLIGPQTLALTLQNGLGNGECLAEVLPRDRIATGMTNWPAELWAPGHVVSRGAGEIRLWSLDGVAHDWIAQVAHALNAAHLNCFADPTVEVSIWEKVAFNAAMNSIAAVSRLSVGAVADSTDGRALAAAVVKEVVAVAHARGIAVNPARVSHSVEFAFANHREHRPSMLQDLLAERATEIEAINGAVVEAARPHGVDVCTVRTLAHLVRLIESAAGAHRTQ